MSVSPVLRRPRMTAQQRAVLDLLHSSDRQTIGAHGRERYEYYEYSTIIQETT